MYLRSLVYGVKADVSLVLREGYEWLKKLEREFWDSDDTI